MTTGSPSRGFARHIPLLIILCAAAIGSLALRDWLSFETLRHHREALLVFRDQNFVGLVIVFVAAYISIAVFSLPGAAVTSMTGGFLFGLALGTVLNVFAASVGASMIFLAARWGLGANLAATLDSSEGKLKQLKNGLRSNEISVLFLLRLVPAVPFFVANLLPAMVGVGFRNFFLTTVLGIIPGAIVFTWIGVGLGEVFDRGETPDLSLLQEPYVVGPMVALCALAALPIVIKALRGRKEI